MQTKHNTNNGVIKRRGKLQKWTLRRDVFRKYVNAMQVFFFYSVDNVTTFRTLAEADWLVYYLSSRT